MAEASNPGGRTGGRAAQGAEREGAPSKPAKAEPFVKMTVVIPRAVYESNKDAIKEPLKTHGLKWQYLGEGRGRYAKPGAGIFVHFKDDGTHYTMSGEDAATLSAIRDAWAALLGPDAFAAAAKQGAEAAQATGLEEDSEATLAWRIGEPQRQRGEPDSYYKLRHDAWLAKRPKSA
jgi:hypothetical protein